MQKYPIAKVEAYNIIAKLFIINLKFCAFRCSWERNHIADVGHPRYEKHQPFQAKAKASVRYRTELAGIDIPPKFILILIHIFVKLYIRWR